MATGPSARNIGVALPVLSSTHMQHVEQKLAQLVQEQHGEQAQREAQKDKAEQRLRAVAETLPTPALRRFLGLSLIHI